MNKYLTILIISLGIFSSSFVLTLAVEQGAPEILFPVEELGGCKDKTECYAYCELPENGSQCLAFAKKYQLMSEEEIRVAEKVQGVKGGPGECNSKSSCENYCNNMDHIDECLAFAEENNLMQGHEMEEARKIQSILKSGGTLPGGCKNKDQCENYCHNPDNMEECLAFAEKSGFIAPEELEQARKFMPLMKSGQTPGGCKSKDQCEAYCDSDEHFDECINFAEKNGMLPEKNRKNMEAFKKTGGKGPGGCRGRQCEVFCQKPENQEACFQWSVDNDMLSDEDKQRMEEGRKNTQEFLGNAPAEVISCIEEVLGSEGLEKMKSGKFFGGEEVGEKVRGCFDKFGPRPPQPEFQGQEKGKDPRESSSEEPMRRPPMPEEYRDGQMMNDGRETQGQYNEQYRQEYQKQFEEQYRQEYEEKYQQMQQQYQQPENQLPPSDIQYTPPPQEVLPPPSREDYNPPTGETYDPVQSMRPAVNLLSLVLGPFLELFK